MEIEEELDVLKIYWDHFFKSETGTYEVSCFVVWSEDFICENSHCDLDLLCYPIFICSFVSKKVISGRVELKGSLSSARYSSISSSVIKGRAYRWWSSSEASAQSVCAVTLFNRRVDNM
ncbi:hypothetical protein ACJJTC_010732 [Scirpophaga incertulas]